MCWQTHQGFCDLEGLMGLRVKLFILFGSEKELRTWKENISFISLRHFYIRFLEFFSPIFNVHSKSMFHEFYGRYHHGI